MTDKQVKDGSGKVVELRDRNGFTILDSLVHLVFKNYKWWCPKCQAFHAGRFGKKMICPFGEDDEET